MPILYTHMPYKHMEIYIITYIVATCQSLMHDQHAGSLNQKPAKPQHDTKRPDTRALLQDALGLPEVLLPAELQSGVLAHASLITSNHIY